MREKEIFSHWLKPSILILALFLTGCGTMGECKDCETTHLSSIGGKPVLGAIPLKHYAVRVVSVDGSIQFRMPVQIEQGPHIVVMEAPTGRSARRGEQRSIALKVAPCTSYIFLAYRDSPMNANWEPILHSEEKIAGCNSDELKKGN